MPITFRHDAASIGGINNSSTRKYGQALVLQQRKYEQDNAMRLRDQLYDAQRQQNLFNFQQGIRNQANQAAVIDNVRQQAIRDMDEKKRQEELQRREAREDARRKEDMAVADQRAKEQAVERARVQQRMDIRDGLDNGEFLEGDATRLRENLTAESTILSNPYSYPAQKAEALSKVRAERENLLKQRIPRQQAQPQIPTFDQYVQANPDKVMKDLSAKMAELNEQAILNKKPYESEDELRAAAAKTLRGNYDILFGRPQAQESAQPAQASPQAAPPQEEAALPTDAPMSDRMESIDAMRNSVSEASRIDAAAMDQAAPAVEPAIPAAQPAAPVAKDPLSEVMPVLVDGNPEEKKAVRQKIDDGLLESLKKRAIEGDPAAEEQIAALMNSLDPEDEYAQSVQTLQSEDPAASLNHLTKIRRQVMSGTLGAKDAIGRLLDAQGKKASEMYRMVSSDRLSKSNNRFSTENMRIRQGIVDSMWSEMGLTKPGQKSAQESDVIDHLMKVGKMSRDDAREYVYKEILSRGYAADVMNKFEGNLLVSEKKFLKTAVFASVPNDVATQ